MWEKNMQNNHFGEKKKNERLLSYGGLLLISCLLILTGCNAHVSTTAGDEQLMSVASPISVAGDIERIEIIHFHGTQQCTSCIAVGDLAEETVNTYFADQVKSGKITFAHINGELPENRELVMKYGVRSASLWIGVYKTDGTFTAEQNTNVWYKINNKADYMTYLKGVIEAKLAGN